MKTKNKIIIMITSLFILICLSICFFLIKKHIDNRYILVYITNKDSKCIDNCSISNKNIKLINKVYKLNYKTIYKSESSKEYKDFIKKYNVDTSEHIEGSILVIIKKDKLVENIDVISFSDLKEILEKRNIIKTDKKEINYNQFLNIYKQNKKRIIYIKTEDYDSEK